MHLRMAAAGGEEEENKGNGKHSSVMVEHNLLCLCCSEVICFALALLNTLGSSCMPLFWHHLNSFPKGSNKDFPKSICYKPWTVNYVFCGLYFILKKKKKKKAHENASVFIMYLFILAYFYK